MKSIATVTIAEGTQVYRINAKTGVQAIRPAILIADLTVSAEAGVNQFGHAGFFFLSDAKSRCFVHLDDATIVTIDA